MKNRALFSESVAVEVRGDTLMNHFISNCPKGLVFLPIRPGAKESILHQVQRAHDVDYVFWDVSRLQKQVFTMEMKAEEKHTGNLVWETASDKGLRPGWGMITKADYLAFVFLDISRIYIVRVAEMREYIRSHRDTLRTGRRQNRNSNGEDLNITEFMLVPVHEIGKAVGWDRQVIRAFDCSGADTKELEAPR